MDPKVEKLAQAIWEYHYPNGGSIFSTYESLPNRDKESLRAEAYMISCYLDGGAEMIARVK